MYLCFQYIQNIIDTTMNNMKRVVLLFVLLGAMALSLRAQESSHREPSFLPAVGVAAVADYTIAWEAGTVAAGVVASSDQKIFVNAGLGAMIHGYVANPVDESNPKAVQTLTLHDVNVYPNPATDFVELDLTTIRGTVEVALFNAMGVSVLHQTVEADAKVRLRLSSLATGLYIVRVTSPEGTLLGVTRLTLQR